MVVQAPPLYSPEKVPVANSFFLYGDSGVGKTRMLADIDGLLCLAIVKEGGAEVLGQGSGSGTKVVLVHHMNDVRAAYNWLVDLRASGKRLPKAVAIDSLTHLQDVAQRDIVVAEHEENPNKRDEELPALQDYLRVQIQLKNLVDAWNALDIPVIYTAARQYGEVVNDEGETEFLHLPQIESKEMKLAMKLCGKMRVIAYLGQTGDGTRRLLTAKRGGYFAKDRSNTLAPVIDNPHFPTILKTMGVET